MSLKSFFDENGYVTVDNVFTPAEMDELIARVDGMERREIPYPESDIKWEPANPSALRNAFGLLHRDPAFRSVATHPEVGLSRRADPGSRSGHLRRRTLCQAGAGRGSGPTPPGHVLLEFPALQDADRLDRVGGCDPRERVPRR